MESKLREIRERVLGELAKAESSAALEQIRVGVLGKKGELTALLRGMGKLPPEERPKAGQRVNEVRSELEGALEAKGEEIKAREKAARLEAEAVDVTLPGPARGAGSLHPMNIALERMIDIFVGMGYEVVEGPEVEYDHYNFELLNLPKNHPARDAQDTFYIDDNIVLRTHTSPVQAHRLPRARLPRRRGRRHALAGVPPDGGPGHRRKHHHGRPEGHAGRVRPPDVRRGHPHALPPVVLPVHGAVG